MEPFLGKRYKLKSSEKFDEYLEFIGTGAVLRNTAGLLSPVCMLTRNDDGSYTFTVEMPLKNQVVTFKLNEEFENERPDGVKVKSIVTMDGNKLIYTEVEANGRKTTQERVFTEDLLTVTITVDGWSGKCIRTFAPVK